MPFFKKYKESEVRRRNVVSTVQSECQVNEKEHAKVNYFAEARKLVQENKEKVAKDIKRDEQIRVQNIRREQRKNHTKQLMKEIGTDIVDEMLGRKVSEEEQPSPPLPLPEGFNRDKYIGVEGKFGFHVDNTNKQIAIRTKESVKVINYSDIVNFELVEEITGRRRNSVSNLAIRIFIADFHEPEVTITFVNSPILPIWIGENTYKDLRSKAQEIIATLNYIQHMK